MAGEAKTAGPLFDPRRSPMRERQVDAIEQEARAEVEAAIAFARSSPPPAPEAVTTQVYAEWPR